MNNKKANGVSAVICCFNSSDVILPTLYGLMTQKVPENAGYEVILVDNMCTDDTVEKAKKYWGNCNISLKIVREETKGLVYSRIRGAKNAAYDITIFIDDDNILQSDYISKAIELFDKLPEIGIVGGYVQPLIQNSSYPNWFLKFQGVYACGAQNKINGNLSGTKKRLYGAGMCIRTSIAKKIFKNEKDLILEGNQGKIQLRGDDTEICQRTLLLGYELYYDSSLILFHNLQPFRLNWKRLCYYRTMGGMVRPVLSIYEEVIAGKKPLSLFSLILRTIREWLNLLKKPKNFLFLHKKGSRVSSDYHLLKGVTLFILNHHSKYNLYIKKVKDSNQL